MKFLKTLSLATILAMSLSASQFGDIKIEIGDKPYDINVTDYDCEIRITPSKAYRGEYLWYAYSHHKMDFAFGLFDTNYNEVKFQDDVDMNALEVWKMGVFGDGVKVGFIENGYDTKNPDVSYEKGYLFDYEYQGLNKEDIDFRNFDSGIEEYTEKGFNHGLSTTSDLAAKHDDFGVAGIAPKAKLYLVALGDSSPDTEEFIEIFDWFEKQGVRVINISMGFERYLEEESGERLVQKMLELEKKGMVIVVASGNENAEGTPYNFDYLFEKGGAIHVGAVVPNGERWTRDDGYGSNYGGFLDFVAPTQYAHDVPLEKCDEIYGTFYPKKNRECKETGMVKAGGGTSLAAPLVAGTIAMILEVNPDLNATEIKDILAKTAIKLGSDAFPLDTGKEYNYTTCVQGEDRNESYNIYELYRDEYAPAYVEGYFYTEDYGYEKITRYVESYYKSHPNPYDTFLCQKHTWNKELGYGLVDAEGAVREAINRIENPDWAKELLAKNSSGYYHFPKRVVDTLKKIAGIETTNRLVEAIKRINDTNWHLLGASEDTSVSELMEAGAKLVWVYRDGNWYAAFEGVEKYKTIHKLDGVIEKGKGVWIVTDGVQREASDTANDNYTDSENVLIASVKDIDKTGWYLLGANKDTDAQEVIDAGADLIWVYRNGKWYVNVDKSKYSIPQGYEAVDTIRADEGVWVRK